MELVPVETLAERIKREGAVPAEDALTIAKKIAEALEGDGAPGYQASGHLRDGSPRVVQYLLMKELVRPSGRSEFKRCPDTTCHRDSMSRGPS